MKSVTGLVLIITVILLTAGCVQEQELPAAPPTTIIQETSVPLTTVPVTPSPGMTPNESLGGPVRFIPGGEYYVGDRIQMTGTTILSPGNQLLIQVYELSFTPTNKSTENTFSGASAIVKVQKGIVNSQNYWEYTLDTSGFNPGDYQVLITGIQVSQFQKSAYFTLLPRG